MFSKIRKNQLSELVKLSGLFLGPGLEVEGEITTEDDVFVDSKFKGQITSEGAVELGKNCHFAGGLKGRTIIMEGIIKANAEADDSIVVAASAEFDGIAEAKTIVVEKGAAINAKLNSSKA